jgi:P22 coat protein - gene protein 5
MALNDVTSVQVAQAIAKVVAARALPPLVGNLVMGNLVNRDFEATMANVGDTVNVPIPPVMVANNLAEAGTVTTQNPSLGNAQIVLNMHAEATFQIPDATRVLVVPDLIDIYMGPAIIALAERIETDLLNTYTLFTANSTQGGNSAFDEARLDAAESALATAKVPAAEPKYAVVSVSAYSAIRQISRFTEFQMTGPTGQPSPMITGALAGGSLTGAMGGTLKGMTIYRSQYVANATEYQNLVFARNALGLVMRRLPQPIPGTGAIAEYAEMGNFGFRVVMSYAPGTLAQQFTVDCLYGVGPLRNNHAVVVQST